MRNRNKRYGVQFGNDRQLTFGEFGTYTQAHWYGTSESAGDAFRVVIL